MNWSQIVLACVTGLGLADCVIFMAWYARRSRMKWALIEHGWFIMYIAFALGSLFGLVLANQIFGNWTGRVVVSIIVFALLVGVTFWLPRILWVSIRLAEKEAKEKKERSI